MDVWIVDCRVTFATENSNGFNPISDGIKNLARVMGGGD